MNRICCAAFLLVSPWMNAAFAQEIHLSIFKIPGAVGLTDVNGITNGGVVYGSVSTAPNTRKGFFLKDGSFTYFEYPGEAVTQVFGMNDTGDFIGIAFSYTGGSFTPVKPFLYRNGVITVLTPPANFTNAGFTGINNRGVIVGAYFDGLEHGLVLKDGNYTSFDVPGCIATRLAGINAAGDMVGQCNRSQAFLFKGGKSTAVAYPGSLTNDVYGLNDRDDMVGVAGLPGGKFIWWVYRNGAFDIIEIPELFAFGKGINASGQIAGEYVITPPGGFNQTSYPVVWQPK